MRASNFGVDPKPSRRRVSVLVATRSGTPWNSDSTRIICIIASQSSTWAARIATEGMRIGSGILAAVADMTFP